MNLPAGSRSRVRIVGDDRATGALLEEWLLADGFEVVGERGVHADVVLVDVAYPRDRGVELLQSVARDHSGVPILALSSGFFPNVECSGPCAQRLGVAGVLPKPVTREALLGALRRLLPSP